MHNRQSTRTCAKSRAGPVIFNVPERPLFEGPTGSKGSIRAAQVNVNRWCLERVQI